MLVFQIFPLESELDSKLELERKILFFFQMSQMSGAWDENGSANFSSEEKGFDGFAAIKASPESLFVLCCSCQRGYFHQK